MTGNNLQTPYEDSKVRVLSGPSQIQERETSGEINYSVKYEAVDGKVLNMGASGSPHAMALICSDLKANGKFEALCRVYKDFMDYLQEKNKGNKVSAKLTIEGKLE